MTGLASQLNCLYINVCIFRNKQKELEVTMLLENHDIVAIAESWWMIATTRMWLSTASS